MVSAGVHGSLPFSQMGIHRTLAFSPAQRDSKAKNSLGTASQPPPGSKIHSPSKLCAEALLRQALWEAAGVGEWKAQGAREAMTQIGGLGKVDH